MWVSPWWRAEEQFAGLFSWPMNGKSTSDIHPTLSATLETTYNMKEAESREPLVMELLTSQDFLLNTINSVIHWLQLKTREMKKFSRV